MTGGLPGCSSPRRSNRCCSRWRNGWWSRCWAVWKHTIRLFSGRAFGRSSVDRADDWTSRPFLGCRLANAIAQGERLDEENDHDHQQEIAAAPDRAAGPRRDAGPPVPRCDVARPDRAGADRREAGPPVPGDLRAQRHGDAVLDAGKRGPRLRADADPRAAGAVPRADAGGLRAPRVVGLRARRGVGVVPDGDAARRAERDRRARQHLDGPDPRARARQDHAARVARGVDGQVRQRRAVHRRPELRLYADHLVAHADDAPADGEQPPRGVRAAVRRQRLGRPRGAAGAPAAEAEHPRLGHRQARRPEGRGGAARPRQAGRVHRGGPRRRAPHRESPSGSATSSRRSPSSRRSRRGSSRTTSG